MGSIGERVVLRATQLLTVICAEIIDYLTSSIGLVSDREVGRQVMYNFRHHRKVCRRLLTVTLVAWQI